MTLRAVAQLETETMSLEPVDNLGELSAVTVAGDSPQPKRSNMDKKNGPPPRVMSAEWLVSLQFLSHTREIITRAEDPIVALAQAMAGRRSSELLGVSVTRR